PGLRRAQSALSRRLPALQREHVSDRMRAFSGRASRRGHTWPLRDTRVLLPTSTQARRSHSFCLCKKNRRAGCAPARSGFILATGCSPCGKGDSLMSLPTDDRQQSQLELEGLKRTWEWTEIKREQLLDRLDLLGLDNARLQARVEELERQVEGLR